MILPSDPAHLRRAQLSGAKKRKAPIDPPAFHSPGYGVSVDHSGPIKSFLAHGPKKTPEIAAMLGLSDATAYRRLSAMADIKEINRGSHRGIKSIVWSLPTDAPIVSDKPRPYVAPFVPNSRSEREFYSHRDVALVARKV